MSQDAIEVVGKIREDAEILTALLKGGRYGEVAAQHILDYSKTLLLLLLADAKNEREMHA